MASLTPIEAESFQAQANKRKRNVYAYVLEGQIKGCFFNVWKALNERHPYPELIEIFYPNGQIRTSANKGGLQQKLDLVFKAEPKIKG